jgi:hypothetical protein
VRRHYGAGEAAALVTLVLLAIGCVVGCLAEVIRALL